MFNLTIISVVLITLALLFYTTGVWAERTKLYLKAWHVVAFWTGFLFDVLGTLAMHKISTSTFNIFELHTLTGQVALWLMLVHASWATVVIKKGREDLRKKFHNYSLFVWLVWLIPYFGGMYIGMAK